MVQWLGIHLAKRRMQVHPWSGTKILDAAEPLSLLTKEAYGATVKTQSSKKKKGGGDGSRTSLAVQWLRLCVPNSGGTDGGTKIVHATRHSLRK